MERDAILIYLRNIYHLEMLKARLTVRYHDARLYYQYRKAQLQKCFAGRPEELGKAPIPDSFLIFCVVMLLLCICFALISALVLKNNFFVLLMFIGIFILSPATIVLFSKYRARKKRSQWESPNALDAENVKKLDSEQQNQKELTLLQNKWRTYEMQIEAESKRISALLQEAYNINLIPAQYRTISAICYIYQWMSTSQSSLEYVLLHTNIEDGIQRVEIKLDSLIRQNSELIFQSRKTEALDSIKTDQILDSLSQIEQSNVDSIYYKAIAANYSHTSDFFRETTCWNHVFP